MLDLNCHINCKLHWECFSTCIKSFILLLWRKKNANKIQTYSGKENASMTCIVIIITMQKIKNLTTNGMYHKNVYILKHKGWIWNFEEEKWQIQWILMINWLNWCRLNYMYTKEIFDNMVILVTIAKILLI